MQPIKILIFLFLLCFGYLQDVQAKVIDLEKIKPLGKIDYIPQPKFEEQTRLIEETPFDDEFLAYRMRIPKDWSENIEMASKDIVEENISQRVLGPLAHYVSPAKEHQRSFVTIETMALTYEIGARNWFINYVIANGLTLEQVGVESKRQVEAIYIEVKGDVTYVVRVKVILNGNRMVVIRYYVTQQRYEQERVLQAQVIKSFELTNREETGVEKLDIYGFLDQSYFDYPVSWTLKSPNVKTIDRMRAMLYHSTMQDKLDGQINLFLTNKLTNTSRAEEIKFFLEKFQIENYRLGKYIETPKMEYHKDMNFGVTQVYEMIPSVSHMFDYELWVSVMEGEEYIYIISLLTPARHEEFYTWARNIEAYRLVVKGMRRHDANVDYYRFIK